MEYVAVVTKEGRRWLAEFPDCPGCQTFAETETALRGAAKEALEGWLEAHLELRRVPPRPKARRRAPTGARLWHVAVDPALAVAVQIRIARDDAQLSQAELAAKAGVSQQQIAKLERPGENPTIATLKKVANALGVALDVRLGAA